MSLPVDEAGFRALEPKCANPTSSGSKRTVAQLSGRQLAFKEEFLDRAVYWGLPYLVRCALEAKISANTRSSCALKRPVLVEAAFTGNSRIVKQLLEAGADHGLTDLLKNTALRLAAEKNHLECIQLLVAAGADANKADDLGHTPAMASVMCKHTECARVLLPISDLSQMSNQGTCVFHCCVCTANEECFEMLLPLIGDVDVRTLPGVYPDGRALARFNETPLILACQHGQQQMAKALLKRGADRMAKDGNQRTPLHWASQNGHLSCLTLLVGQPGRRKMTPAEVDAVDVKGATALHIAAELGFDKIAGVLLEAGARLDLKTAKGGTPLMYAQQLHPTNAALLALLSGAGPAQPPGTVCDHCGKTAAQASVNSLKACSECHAVRYCSAACGAAAWKGHKKACRARAKEREAKTKPNFVSGTP